MADAGEDSCDTLIYDRSRFSNAGFFKGTSADQDRRFSDKEVKLLKSMKFPPEFNKKVSHCGPHRLSKWKLIITTRLTCAK